MYAIVRRLWRGGPDRLRGRAPVVRPTLAEDAKFKAIYTTEWAWRDAQFPGQNDDENSPDRRSPAPDG